MSGRPTFQQLAQSDQFVSLMKMADRLGLDTKHLMKQAQEMSSAGYHIDAIGEWLTGIVDAAARVTQQDLNMKNKNGGKQMTPGQMTGREPVYSDNNMPRGTFLEVRPQLHCSVLNEMIITSLAGLMEMCKRDPKGVNPYNFRNISLNRFLDEQAERQFWSPNVPERIETGEFEEMETTDPQTKKKVTKKVPIMKDNPHHTLIMKKLKAEQAGKYQQWDPVTELFPKWMEDTDGDDGTGPVPNEFGVTDEEVKIFKDGIKNIRSNLQSTLFMHNLYQYVNVIQANTIHDASQLSENLDDIDKAREYQQNQITITRKGTGFLQMYLYTWPQADQKGIYANYIMMGMQKDLTW